MGFIVSLVIVVYVCNPNSFGESEGKKLGNISFLLF